LAYRDEFPREFWEKVAQRQSKGQRYGQAVYNAAFEMWPHLVTPLNASTYDPFHRDERVAAFLNVLLERRHHHEITDKPLGEG
jgi:hypothetical protein